MKLTRILFVAAVVAVSALGAIVTKAENKTVPTLVYYYDNPSSPDRVCLSTTLELSPCDLVSSFNCTKAIAPLSGAIRQVYANIDEDTQECIDPYKRSTP